MKPIFIKMDDNSSKKGNFIKLPFSFNIDELQKATNELFTKMSWKQHIVKGLCMTQIPGDPSSADGDKLRGVFYTKPDSTGKEVQRENAIDESRFSLDPMETVEKQVERLIKSIKPLIPISFEKIRVAVKIRAIHVGKCYGQISSLANIQSEEYQKDGSWIGIIEMAAAAQTKLEDLLGSVTKGTAEIKAL